MKQPNQPAQDQVAVSFRREPAGGLERTRWRILTDLGDARTGHLGAAARRHLNPYGGHVHRGFWVGIRFGEHSAYYVDPAGRAVDWNRPDRVHPFASRQQAAEAVVRAWLRERQAVA